MHGVSVDNGSLQLRSRVLGPLPVLNHFLARLRIEDILAGRLPRGGNHVSHEQCLGVLLRNIVLGRAPVYGLGEWAEPFLPSVLGLDQSQAERLNDDRVGRALDHLFDADRASMQTEMVVTAIREFELELEQFHNDSTSLTFTGQYRDADGDNKRGKSSLRIARGHNKDHRPDLKQLLWILTVTADGAVPVHYRACDGNTTDSPTHQESWEAIRALVGRPDFLYVADCKLCTDGNIKHIDSKHGRFITVLPRNRKEDEWFREYIQSHEVPWEEVCRQPDPRVMGGTPDVYRMVESPMPSAEGFRIVWVWSSKKAEKDLAARQGLMERAVIGVEQVETRLRNPRNRLYERADVVEAVEKAIGLRAGRWIGYEIHDEEDASYRQERPGRPGKDTRYRREVRVRYHVEWYPKGEHIEFDGASDGMFPLITNCTELSHKDILAKYKYQPYLEKRHEQLKNVYGVAPVFLKNVTRIEALLFLYFTAILVQALIERQVRRGMEERGIESLPVYPEERECEAPTTTRLLTMFDNLQIHDLWDGGTRVQTFLPELSEMQKELLELMEVPAEVYTKVV